MFLIFFSSNERSGWLSKVWNASGRDVKLAPGSTEQVEHRIGLSCKVKAKNDYINITGLALLVPLLLEYSQHKLVQHMSPHEKAALFLQVVFLQ